MGRHSAPEPEDGRPGGPHPDREPRSRDDGPRTDSTAAIPRIGDPGTPPRRPSRASGDWSVGRGLRETTGRSPRVDTSGPRPAGQAPADAGSPGAGSAASAPSPMPAAPHDPATITPDTETDLMRIIRTAAGETGPAPLRPRTPPPAAAPTPEPAPAVETPEYGDVTRPTSSDGRRRTPARTTLLMALAAALIGTIVGAVLLWPTGEPPKPEQSLQRSSLLSATTVTGTVVDAGRGACGSPSSGRVFEGEPQEPPTFPGAPAPQECDRAVVRIDECSDQGRNTLIETAGLPGDPDLAVGEKVRLAVEEQPAPGAMPGTPGAPGAPAPGAPAQGAQGQAVAAQAASSNLYTFMDMERSTPLLLWLAVAVAGITLVGALRGVRSLVGLGVTLVVIAVFLLPALLRGGPPTGLAVITGAAIVFLAVPLVHGVNWKSAASMGGTLLALSISAVLAQLAIASTSLRGLADDNNLLIHLHFPAVDVTGLLLAGFIVGSLGVLNDVTIAQASTVTELAEADPDASVTRLFRSAMRVGRDHIASMVYTLVLTYTGATLPLLLLITASERPLLHMLTSDVVATELLRSGVGTLGLVLAVPLTTIIAAATARGRRTRAAA